MSGIDETLAAIRERAQAATPGPWVFVENFTMSSVRFEDPTARLGFRGVAQVPRRLAGLGHEFLPVNGHPDDDECTFRADGTDATYCGLAKAEHGLRRAGDAEFIAHAREDVPALLAAVEAVLALADEWRHRLDQSRSDYYLFGLSDAGERMRAAIAKALGTQS